MNKREINKDIKSNIFMTIFKSIIIILPIPISFLIIVEMVSLHLLEENIDKYEERITEKVVEQLHQEYYDIYSILYELSDDVDISSYMKSQKRDYYKEYSIKNVLLKKLAGNEMIKELYIFFPQYSHILSTNTSVDSTIYHDRYYTNTYSEWLFQMYNTTSKRTVFHFLTEEREDNPNILTIGKKESSAQHAKIVARINEDYIVSVLNKFCVGDSDYAFLMIDNTLLASNCKGEMREMLTQALLEKERNKTLLKIDGINYTIMYEVRVGNEMRLIRISDNNAKNTILSITKIIASAAVSLCVFVMIAMILNATYRNYIPIKHWMLLLQIDDEDMMSVNYQTLDSYISHYIDQNKAVHQRLQQYKRNMNLLFVEKILLEGIDNYRDDRLLKELENDCEGKYFVVILYVNNAMDESAHNGQTMSYEILRDYVEEYFNEFRYLSVERSIKEIYWIINGESNNGICFQEKVEAITQEMLYSIAENEKIYYESYTSNCYESLSEIHLGYQELKQKRDSLRTKKDKSEYQKDANLINLVLEAIEREVSNVNLSVASLSEQLCVNPSYLSRVFKQKQGIGILEFVHVRRVELAKELFLEEKETKSKEIAERVGFYNVSTFIRVFKKIEGITPGEYREKLKQED